MLYLLDKYDLADFLPFWTDRQTQGLTDTQGQRGKSGYAIPFGQIWFGGFLISDPFGQKNPGSHSPVGETKPEVSQK